MAFIIRRLKFQSKICGALISSLNSGFHKVLQVCLTCGLVIVIYRKQNFLRRQFIRPQRNVCVNLPKSDRQRIILTMHGNKNRLKLIETELEFDNEN